MIAPEQLIRISSITFAFIGLSIVGMTGELDSYVKMNSKSSTTTEKLLLPLYSNESPVNLKIPSDATYEASSDQYMSAFASNQAGDAFVMSLTGWSYPVFFSTSQTPRYNVSLLEAFGQDNVIVNMPIPDNAVPDPEDDGHLVVIDNQTGMEFDLWQAKKDGDNWKASWGNVITVNSNGFYPFGLSARGSGFAAGSGLVWPEELDSGVIDHALFFSIDDLFVRGGGPIRPATESDGESSYEWSLPEGARLQLDPSIDVSSLALSPGEKVIARAMQEYGMFLGDRGGGFSLYGLNPINQGWSWDEYFTPNEYGFVELFNGEISIKDLKVLTMECQISPEVNNPGYSLPTYQMYTATSPPETCNFGPEIHQVSEPKILSPLPNDVVEDPITIHWEMSVDSWGEYVSFEVFISSDGGLSWRSLVRGLSDNALVLDTTELEEETNYLLRVVAEEPEEGLKSEWTMEGSFSINHSDNSDTSLSDDPSTTSGLALSSVVGIVISVVLFRLFFRKRDVL